jgi:hypothetical protein
MGTGGRRDAENERAMIDANWGSSTDIVYQFCRQSQWGGVIYPAHGRYVGASSKPMTEYRKQPGDRLGFNWMMPNVAGKRAIRHVIFDSTSGNRSSMPDWPCRWETRAASRSMDGIRRFIS